MILGVDDMQADCTVHVAVFIERFTAPKKTARFLTIMFITREESTYI
jgi:hypothetical protein